MIKERITLSKLQMLIRDSIVLSMPDSYWIIAEISELKVNYSGHCYLELIEKSSNNDNIRARARATIWAARYRTLRPFFESSTGESLREGLSVLVKATVEYHELYGLSLNISDIDPAFTMGDIALRRQEIIRRLTAEGVTDMNKGLQMPLLPKRIAVISSSTAAGYEDFRKQLLNNSSGYGYYTELFSSPMQGSDTPGGIISALDSISMREGDFDLVAILRGGGSTADLQWFDNYDVAFHITQYPLPVLTGIGHEKDVSVIDMVAWRSLKTPTAVASFIIEMTANADAIVGEYLLRLKEATASIIREADSKCTGAGRKITPLTLRITALATRRVNSITTAISSSTHNLLRGVGITVAVSYKSLMNLSRQRTGKEKNQIPDREKRLRRSAGEVTRKASDRINGADNMIKLASPENILRKGFTITTVNGKTIFSVTNIEKGDIITTSYSDGYSYSKVEEKKTSK